MSCGKERAQDNTSSTYFTDERQTWEAMLVELKECPTVCKTLYNELKKRGGYPFWYSRIGDMWANVDLNRIDTSTAREIRNRKKRRTEHDGR